MDKDPSEPFVSSYVSFLLFMFQECFLSNIGCFRGEKKVTKVVKIIRKFTEKCKKRSTDNSIQCIEKLKF